MLFNHVIMKGNWKQQNIFMIYKLIWLSDTCMRMQVIQILTQVLIMQNIVGIFV